MTEIWKEYEMLDIIEHTLRRPDTMIGSIEKHTETSYIYDKKQQKFLNKKITFTDGLYQIFNEVITNCVDEHIKKGLINKIDIHIDTNSGKISIGDNGGIPVIKHPEYNMYIPEFIFSVPMSGGNYNDNVDRYGAGRNGLGVKCTNIFSNLFVVDTADGNNSFKQEFQNNLSISNPYSIKKSKKSYTNVSFIPDYKRFNYTNGIDKDFIDIIRTRIVQIAGINEKLKLSLQIDNNEIERYSFKSFNQFVELFGKDEIIYDENDNWKIAITHSNNSQFTNTSFINSLEVKNGGTHIDYVMSQITSYIKDEIKKKYKVNVFPSNIKNHIHIFVSCNINQPSFDSQTKHRLITDSKKFDSSYEANKKFLNKIMNSSIIESVLLWAQKRQDEIELLELKKANRSIDKIKIPKLIDAKSKNRNECSLFIFEGDSAKNGFRKYRDVNKHGAIPLRGNVLNVSKVSKVSDIINNDEIKTIMSTLGLKLDEPPTNLRYKDIYITTDADKDGDKIAALLINFLYTYWKELFINGNVYRVLTPIVVAKRNKYKTLQFYSDLEFENWMKNTSDFKLWNVEYKKGLAALHNEEYKELIYNPKLLQFKVDKDTDELLEIWFTDKQKDKKKKLVNSEFVNEIIYPDSKKIEKSISDFLKNEYLGFAFYTIEQRAIPSMIDGFKPVQRKIVASGIDIWKNNKSTKKVYQYSGTCADSKLYHHGNQSLENAIINMVQSFMNNLPLFDEDGQYGNLRNPEAGAPRYIGTKLNNVFNKVYVDNNLLENKIEEGVKIEPKYYLPIIPMVLINGTSGIAVGVATKILNRNPKYIVDLCIDILKNKNVKRIPKPYIKEFTGDITLVDTLKWQFNGKFEIVNSNTVKITEIPPHFSFESYENHLINLQKTKKIVDYEDNCTNKIEYVIKFNREELSKHTDESLIKLLKLSKTETENLTTLDENNKLKVFDSVLDLIQYFINFRLKYYEKRRLNYIDKYTKENIHYQNKMNFINLVINDNIKIYKQSKDNIIKQINKFKLVKIEDSFNYLLNMPITIFTKEQIRNLTDKMKENNHLIKFYKSISNKELYLSDLEKLKTEI